MNVRQILLAMMHSSLSNREFEADIARRGAEFLEYIYIVLIQCTIQSLRLLKLFTLYYLTDLSVEHRLGFSGHVVIDARLFIHIHMPLCIAR